MSANVNQKKTSDAALAQVFRNADDFKSVYINFVQTAATPVDISLIVGDANPTPRGVPDIEMKLRLIMAPVQAKVTLAMLLEVVRQYEEQYGKIAVPAGMLAELPENESGVHKPGKNEG